MQTIPNVLTQSGYVDALTIGPDNYEGIAAEVWNNPCIMEVHSQPSSGYQLGEWLDEVVVASGSSPFLDRCAGLRFKTQAGSQPARIIAYAWKDGEPRLSPGSQLIGTIGSSGGVTPGGAMITGAVNADGSVAYGTGFSVAHPSTSNYTVTFTTAFGATPIVVANVLENASRIVAIYNVTTTSFNAHLVFPGGGDDNRAWNFIAQAVS